MPGFGDGCSGPLGGLLPSGFGVDLRVEGFGDGLRVAGFGDGLRLEDFGVAGGLRLEGSGVAAGFLLEGFGVSGTFGLEGFGVSGTFGLEGLGVESFRLRRRTSEWGSKALVCLAVLGLKSSVASARGLTPSGFRGYPSSGSTW